ncbi:MAG: hypothetical protein RDV41_08365 [Planctomycetota bacterium]|nr:hypothetical protein [Planctomycetota bacterium]
MKEFPLLRRSIVMHIVRCTLLALGVILLLALGCAAPTQARIISCRIEPEGFKSNAADIEAICRSAAGALLRWFPGYEVPPFVVVRRHGGPVIGFHKNDQGEIVIYLDTEGTYWCQYSYQFAHEFCHLLCGYDDDFKGNMWFEETLAETASIFALRAMARTWKDNPPYPNWKEYRDALHDYADDVVKSRSKASEIRENGLNGFYLAHKTELDKDPGNRELNGAMAVVFLHLFEEDPARWESVRWLNSSPSPEGETFTQYFRKWHDAVPDRHRELVEDIARLFGIDLAR